MDNMNNVVAAIMIRTKGRTRFVAELGVREYMRMILGEEELFLPW